MQIDPLIASIVGVLLTLLIGMVGWFARHNYLRLERELEEERKDRVADKEQASKDLTGLNDRYRMELETHRQEMRAAINGVGQRIQALNDKVLSECINEEHLSRALKPVMDKLAEIRVDFKEIYLRLEKKQERPGDD